MTQWTVKDFSNLAGVSVQTLHHYDRIDLLKPSVRLTNGYRVYSEKDLLQLQQIIALKFFGFELSKIKALLTGTAGALEHFTAQAQFLEEKAKSYVTASQTLKSIITAAKDDKSIPWQSVIKLIEVYHMTAELEKTWAGEVLTPEELKQYANFEASLKTRFTSKDRELFTASWLALVNEVKANLKSDPKSDEGLRLAKQIMALVSGLYGKENANLRHSIWEKGFKKGKMDGDRALAPEVVEWIDKAIDNYYRERIYALLDQIELGATPTLVQSWNELMTEMFGDSEELKKAAFAAGASEDESRIGPKAKKWLQQFLK
jgi:DNA-binding transcriptional MerR regulator